MISWSERRRYSAAHDCEMARITGFDDHHQGHWMMIETGKGYRDRRNETVLRIQDSIDAGDPAGKVEPAKS